MYFFSTTVSTEYFKHGAHSPFFSSKCRLFHNATFFGSCIIHILHTAVLCSWSGRPAPTTNTARMSPRYEGKTRGCHCSHWAPDDGRETPESCWAV